MLQDTDRDNFNKDTIGGVYTITHTASGRAYIGESTNVRRRLRDHRNALLKHKHNNPFLQHAWDKYGPQEFIFKLFQAFPKNAGETYYPYKDRLRLEENNILKLFPNNFNCEVPGLEVLVPGPQYLENLKRSNKASWQDPVKKAAHVAGYRTPEARENRKAAAKTGWEKRHKNRENPEFMVREQERAKKAGASIKKRYNTPEGKAALSKQAIETWSNPETKIKLSATLKSFYTDQVNREMIAQKMRESWARRKAEKAAKLAESNSAYTASSEPPTA